MRNIRAPSVTGESRFREMLLDRNWKTCKHGKMKSHPCPSSQMKKKFLPRSSTTRKNSEHTFLHSAILSWELQRKRKLSVSISARLKVPRSCWHLRQISFDRSSTSGHQLHQKLHPSWKPPSPLANLVQPSSKSSWPSTVSTIPNNSRKISRPSHTTSSESPASHQVGHNLSNQHQVDPTPARQHRTPSPSPLPCTRKLAQSYQAFHPVTTMPIHHTSEASPGSKSRISA